MRDTFIRLVAFFGGQQETATALGVSQGTVSGCVRGVHGCSADVALRAQRKTSGQFPAHLLRPSLLDGTESDEVNDTRVDADEAGPR